MQAQIVTVRFCLCHLLQIFKILLYFYSSSRETCEITIRSCSGMVVNYVREEMSLCETKEECQHE